ncbi:hypothetical protein [Microvirga thermotolerans]|uniref:HEPN domain-containing protein n=1 Tax=Microvirga thermotolerans TaxID=2651334 RepID=A0A5P9JWH2_9HYPH|nr:hypothetical protein [Microvirga thermotolerans]QFU16569.1 hypothetical protein GDR74_10200 [Microvirga thermotolerans]
MTDYPDHLLARDFLERAEEFYGAFRALPAKKPISWPRYYLLTHTIELSLKAFLLRKGVSRADLWKKFRHNINSLLSEAMSRGLRIGPLAAGELEHLHEAHSKHWPRYPTTPGKPIFLIEPFEPYVVELLRAVAAEMRGEVMVPPLDDENPEWTAEDFARATPAADVLPPEVLAAFLKSKGTSST